MARKAAVTVRGPGVRIAPKSETCAWPQTRSEKSGAKGAKTSMIASGRGGRGGHLRSHALGQKRIYHKGPPAPIRDLLPPPAQNGQSGVYLSHITDLDTII